MATAEPEAVAVDFEPEDDDLMDEEGGAAEDHSPRAPPPRLRSAITGAGASSAQTRKTKGRGFRHDGADRHEGRLSGRDFDSLDSDNRTGPARCKFSSPPFFSLYLYGVRMFGVSD